MGVLECWVLNASLHYSGRPWRAGYGFLSESVPFRIVRINGLTLENKIPLNCVVVFEVNVLSQCGVVHFILRRFGHVSG